MKQEGIWKQAYRRRCNCCGETIRIYVCSNHPFSGLYTSCDVISAVMKKQTCNTHRDVQVEVNGFLKIDETKSTIIRCEDEDMELVGYTTLEQIPC